MPTKKADKKNELTYKGKPMVRCGNVIYYGNPEDPCVIMFQILSTRKFKDMEIPSDVIVQLISTDVNLKPKQRIMKHSQKDSFYNAIDIGVIWLDRALSGKY